MRYARPVTFAFSAVLAVGVLVACGGGGGGSTTPATVTAPSGNGAPPVTTTTTAPGTTTTPVPGASTTPPSNSTTPPSTTTTPPSNSTTPPSTTSSSPSTTAPQTSNAVLNVGYGQPNGNPQPFLAANTTSNSRGYQGGGDMPSGGQGQTVDGISCQPTMSEYYHVHIFVGIMQNGQEVAVPAGVGMKNPSPPDQYVDNDTVVTPSPTGTMDPNAIGGQSWTADCYYDMHVHDNSGMIHVETANNGKCGVWTNGGNSTPAPVATDQEKPCNYQAPWTLQNFLDIWGISVGPSNFGPLQGSVQVYTTPPGYNAYSACPSNSPIVNTPCETSNTSYLATTVSKALGMPLYSHTTFWFVVGTPGPYTAANTLPSINWVEGNP